MSFIVNNPTLINSKYADILCHRVQVLVIPCALPGHENATLIFCWSNFSFALLWHRFPYRFWGVTSFIFLPAFHHFRTNTWIDDGRLGPLGIPKIPSRVNVVDNMRILALSPWKMPVQLSMEWPGHSISSASWSFLLSSYLSKGPRSELHSRRLATLGLPLFLPRRVNLDSSDHTTFYLCSIVKSLLKPFSLLD